jgi:hypothetical protein
MCANRHVVLAVKKKKFVDIREVLRMYSRSGFLNHITSQLSKYLQTNTSLFYPTNALCMLTPLNSHCYTPTCFSPLGTILTEY